MFIKRCEVKRDVADKRDADAQYYYKNKHYKRNANAAYGYGGYGYKRDADETKRDADYYKREAGDPASKREAYQWIL